MISRDLWNLPRAGKQPLLKKIATNFGTCLEHFRAWLKHEWNMCGVSFSAQRTAQKFEPRLSLCLIRLHRWLGCDSSSNSNSSRLARNTKFHLGLLISGLQKYKQQKHTTNIRKTLSKQFEYISFFILHLRNQYRWLWFQLLFEFEFVLTVTPFWFFLLIAECLAASPVCDK